MNKTFTINTNIEYIADLHPSVSQFASESFTEIAKKAVFKWNVLEYASYTMISATILGILVNAFNKALQVYCYRREIRRFQEN